MKAGDQPVRVEVTEKLPKKARTIFLDDDAEAWAEASETATEAGKADGKGRRASGNGKRTNGAGVKEKSTAARAGSRSAKKESSPNTSGKSAKAGAKRAKARKPNEKITPASIFRKMIAFGKVYQIDNEQDFQEAARIYAEEAGLIDQMRDRLAEDGLTVLKTYKTGDVEVAHPLLSELPRHVESANKCLTTIGSMVSDRGAKKEKAARDLDAFRLH